MRPVASDEDDPALKGRRVPQQTRSRDRVERILDAAATLVVTDGVEALTTRSIAERAGVPVASLYQYFADKDQVLLALIARDVDQADLKVAEALAGLPLLTVGAIVEAVVDAYVEVYEERASFVVVWLRGRISPTIRAFGRRRNRRTAQGLLAFAQHHGLLVEEAALVHADIAVEMADRLMMLAFEHSMTADPVVVAEARALLVGYVERFASPAGLEGVPQTS